MNNNILIEFLSIRPAINVDALIRELGEDKRNFYAYLQKRRKIPAPKRGVFYRTLKRYGHVFDFDCDLPILFYPV